MLARDLSNFTAPLTSAMLEVWKAEGFGLVIIQAVDPPPGYPAGRTRAQVQQCLDAGLIVDAYVWLWFDAGIDDIRHKLALLDGLSIRQLWLDVEDTAAKGYDTVVCEQKVAEALDLCDQFSTTGGKPTGIYSATWFWVPSAYMGNSEEFKDRKLWAAKYDGAADAEVFTPFGGWTACRIKQYAGSQPDGTDLNVLSAAEEAELHPQTPADCAPLISGLAYVADDLGDQLIAEAKRSSVRKTVVRKIVTEMARVRLETVGPRP